LLTQAGLSEDLRHALEAGTDFELRIERSPFHVI
jgi:hypothetical protein